MGAVEETFWGRNGSQPVYLYTLHGKTGAAAQVTNYGASLQSLNIPHPDGELIDVVLGFDHFYEYQGEHPFFGATVGRCANRIAGGCFNLGGRSHNLAINDSVRPNHIHSGTKGFDKQVWETSDFGQNSEGPYVKLTYTSRAGEEGYPGTVKATVTYALSEENKLHIVMEAETDRLTLVNLTNHSYWNLNGHQSGPVVNHNFVLRDAGGRMRQAARVVADESGLIMETSTNQPSLQFYTANFLHQGLSGKNGAIYSKHHAFCLETQTFPDAINRRGLPGWPSVLLSPDEHYHHTVCYAFSAD